MDWESELKFCRKAWEAAVLMSLPSLFIRFQICLFQQVRHLADRREHNHVIQTFPAPPGTGKGEERQTGRSRVLTGSEWLQRPSTPHDSLEYPGRFWKPGDPLRSCDAWGAADPPGPALAVTRPGSSWRKADFSPRQLEKSCKPHLLSPHPNRANSLFCNGAGHCCCHTKRDEKWILRKCEKKAGK